MNALNNLREKGTSLTPGEVELLLLLLLLLLLILLLLSLLIYFKLTKLQQFLPK